MIITQKIKRILYEPIITHIEGLIKFHDDQIKFLRETYDENKDKYRTETLINLKDQIYYNTVRRESYEKVLVIIEDYILE